jgi:glycine/D-amino acid oxidase-like deaminating enzyme
MGKSLSDVLIVGGGVIGCLTAYYLSKAGHKITVIEADTVACGASGKSGGWLTPYSHRNDPAMLALSPKSLDLHRTLSKVLPEETGVDYGFEETPFLRCAITEEGVSELQSWQVERAAEGNVMEWISPSDIRQVNSWVTDPIRICMKM